MGFSYQVPVYTSSSTYESTHSLNCTLDHLLLTCSLLGIYNVATTQATNSSAVFVTGLKQYSSYQSVLFPLTYILLFIPSSMPTHTDHSQVTVDKVSATVYSTKLLRSPLPSSSPTSMPSCNIGSIKVNGTICGYCPAGYASTYSLTYSLIHSLVLTPAGTTQIHITCLSVNNVQSATIVLRVRHRAVLVRI